MQVHVCGTRRGSNGVFAMHGRLMDGLVLWPGKGPGGLLGATLELDPEKNLVTSLQRKAWHRTLELEPGNNYA